MNITMTEAELAVRCQLPRNPLIGLTQTQECALEFAQYTSLGDGHYCEETDATRLPTLNALVKRGYLHKPTMGRYWLTEKGKRAHKILTRARTQKDAIRILCDVIKEALSWHETEHGSDAEIEANDFSVPDWVLQARFELDQNEHLADSK